MGKGAKTGYLRDVSDEEWAFVLPYLLLSRVDNASREHDLRAIFNAVRYVVKGGNQWRLMPNDLPPVAVGLPADAALDAGGCFERIVEDVQSLLRQFGGRKGQPTAVCIDSRTLQSTPESGARAAYDGAKRRKGSKVHIAVDTLGHLIALTVTPADAGDRSQIAVRSQL
jgi:transposase